MDAMEHAASYGPRIAFFGGSFDPPHRGHLAIARAARAALRLDTVLFAPVGTQPLKPLGATAGFEHRVAMTRLAIADEPGFAVSLADAPEPAGKPNYTIDTLHAVRAQSPPGAQLFCLMGADSFLGLRRWHRGAEIPFVAPLIVASRPGESLADLAAVLPAGLSIAPGPVEPTPAEVDASAGVELRCYTLRAANGRSTPFYLLPGMEIDISASHIRLQAQAAGDRFTSGHELLPNAVAEYIAAHRLYR